MILTGNSKWAAGGNGAYSLGSAQVKPKKRRQLLPPCAVRVLGDWNLPEDPAEVARKALNRRDIAAAKTCEENRRIIAEAKTITAKFRHLLNVPKPDEPMKPSFVMTPEERAEMEEIVRLVNASAKPPGQPNPPCK